MLFACFVFCASVLLPVLFQYGVLLFCFFAVSVVCSLLGVFCLLIYVLLLCCVVLLLLVLGCCCCFFADWFVYFPCLLFCCFD